MMKKNILIITPRFPYPVIGGDKLRIYHICKELSKQYSLTLLSLCETKDELSFVPCDDGVFEYIHCIEHPKWMSYMRTFLALPFSTPLQIAYYKNNAFAKKIQSLLPHHDAVLSHLIRTGDYVKNIDKPSILEMTDAISLNYGRVKALRGTGGLRGVIYRLESKRLKAYEKKIVNDFDLSVLVSETDKVFLFGDDAKNDVLVCSNGVDLSGLPYSPPDLTSQVIVFIGNMRTIQNQDACHYFINEILPLLCVRGDFKFRIVGAISDALADEYRKVKNVEVTGRVECIADVVRDASIGVCPMRLGAGVQNKVLEYMALGIPTITTTLGYEGIHATPGQDLLIADTPDQFVQKILWLVHHADDATVMSNHARKFVESSHEWSAVLKPFMDRVGALV